MRNLLSIILIGLTLTASADTLTLEEAMQTALKQNLSIQVSRNNTVQAENRTTIGNAGMLPSISANANGSYSTSKTSLEFAGGIPPITDLPAESQNVGANVQMNYTIFGGLGAINTYENLKNGLQLSEIQSRLTIESTILQVCNVYYEVARQQVQIDIAKQSLLISRRRLERLISREAYGTAGSLDVLNAQVDLNADSSTVLSLEIALSSAKRNLNALLNRDPASEFEVSTSVSFQEDNLDVITFEKNTLENNVNILLSQVQLNMSEVDKKIQKSFMMPRVMLNANYGYTLSESNASIMLSNENLGLTGGLTFSWNLFDGHRKHIALTNAQIAIENNILLIDEAKLMIKKDFANAHFIFEQNKKILELESMNIKVAESNFNRSKELFELGQLTTLQYREAQLNLNRTKSRWNTANFTTKMAEIELRRLAGMLIN